MNRLFLCLLLLGLECAAADSMPILFEGIHQAKPSQEAVDKAKKQLAELNERKLQELSLKPFHWRKQNPLNKSDVYCTQCHTLLPHHSSERTRAFLNMHTDYVACETCHFRPETIRLEYGWFDYQKESVVSPSEQLWRSGRTADDKTLMVARDGNLKIIPLLNGQPASVSKNHALAKAVYNQWKHLGLEHKAQFKAKLHAPLNSNGPECQACHISAETARLSTDPKRRKEPLLDVKALGANVRQQQAFENNTIAGFFARYLPEEQPEQISKEQQRIRITEFLK